MWNRETLIWATGLFEGEGYIGRRQHRREGEDVGLPVWRLALGMTDRDVVERFHAAWGFGSITKQERSDGRKDVWYWEVRRKDHVYAVLAAMHPWLGQRRKAKARQALEELPPVYKRRFREIECIVCGAPFTPRNNRQLQCGAYACMRELRNENRRRPLGERECIICGESFVMKSSRHKTCSDACFVVHRDTYIRNYRKANPKPYQRRPDPPKRSCHVCETVFQPSRYVPNKNVFCSAACRREGSRIRAEQQRMRNKAKQS